MAFRKRARLNPHSPQAKAIREEKERLRKEAYAAKQAEWAAKREAKAEEKRLKELAIEQARPQRFYIPDNTIVLPAHGWKTRPYQEKFWTYMTGEDGRGDGRGKFAVLNWHRRAGKDALLLNLIATLTTRRVGMYWHAFPLLNQARRAIWEGFMNSEGRRMLDYLPPELRVENGSNQQELRINLKTGSTYQLVGGDNPDKLTGSGPIGIGFSEYAQMDPDMWNYTSPILGENKGWVVFISTPRGKNHFYDIYNYALNTPGCFAETLTIDDTTYTDADGKVVPVITQEYLDQQRKQGKSEEFLRQEYYCDWNSSAEGAVYARQISECESQGRVGDYGLMRDLPVHTAWDFGFRDSTVILFFQIDRQDNVRIIDYESDQQKGIPHYCRLIHDKGYKYGTHYGPWDVTNRSVHYGNSIMDVAAENGVRFRRLLKQRVNDGIEGVRAAFPRLHFNKATTGKLWDALKSYTYEVVDEEHKQLAPEPEHSWASHGADGLRYLCMSLPKTQKALEPYRMHEISRRNSSPEPSWDVLQPVAGNF